MALMMFIAKQLFVIIIDAIYHLIFYLEHNITWLKFFVGENYVYAIQW